MVGDFLAMLEVRSSDALPAWLAERLRSVNPGVRTRVLRIYPGRAARQKGAESVEAFAMTGGLDQGRQVPVDAMLREALRGKSPISSPPGEEPRLLAPFDAGGAVRHVVEVSGRIEDPEAVNSLVAVARKYYIRLVEGETDPLTRLASRRLFQSHVDAGLRRWTGPGRSYYFAMLDLDRFKRINDEFGHLYGDEILVHFANLMRATFRSGDLLYRFGGEEFVVVFGVDPPEHGGQATLERFRTAVEDYLFPGVGRVTVSIGFTRVAEGVPAAVLIDRADEALYYAKAHGRNRVCHWDGLVERGEIAPKAVAKKDVTLF